MEEYNKKMDLRESLLKIVTPIKKQKKNLKVLGFSLIGVGAITFFIPFSTIPLISVGCLCLGVSYDYIKRIGKYKAKNGIFTREIKNKVLLLRSNLK